MDDHTINRAARTLEWSAIGLALLALLFRATVYRRMPAPPGASYGAGDVVDFGLGLALFLVCLVCGASGVAMSMRLPPEQRGAAYRPLVVGITTFVAYYFLHPYVPRLL